MTSSLVLAVDAMGGDGAPEMVLEGVRIALERSPDLLFLIYGDRDLLVTFKAWEALKDRCQLCHSDQVVANDDKPSVALRKARRSSMRLAVDAVRDGLAQGVISAGNTGALMAIAKFVLKTLPGIDRPAIATFHPTMRGESLMLDLGANIDCDANNLVQFAVMGEVFARTVLGLEKPTIGLLNVGSEEVKGHEAVREAARFLRKVSLPIHFHGFIEGNDIGAGTVDVVVTDGFTGNIALKTAEGITALYGRFLREAFASSWSGKLGYMLAQSALGRLRERIDPRKYNGAMLLGLNGIVVKSHGGTDALGFASAVDVAADLAKNGFNDHIKAEFDQLFQGRSGKKLVDI